MQNRTPAPAGYRAGQLAEQRHLLDPAVPVPPSGLTVPTVAEAVYDQALADIRAISHLTTWRPAPVRRKATPGDDCGTRSGYRRHLRTGETPDPRCSKANTAADRRLRETGTTKLVAP